MSANRGRNEAVILGHSFIRRLHHDLSSYFAGAPEGELPRLTAQYLKVHHNIPKVYLYGESGAMADSFPVPHTWLDSISPTIVLIELGTNDLARGTPAEHVASCLWQMVMKLHCSFPAIIGILSVVPRSHKLYISQHNFLQACAQLESTLKCKVQGYSNIFYHKHKGFYEIEFQGKKSPKPIESWSLDGIHPNTEAGQKSYQSSLRDALSMALRLQRSQALSQ